MELKKCSKTTSALLVRKHDEAVQHREACRTVTHKRYAWIVSLVTEVSIVVLHPSILTVIIKTLMPTAARWSNRATNDSGTPVNVMHIFDKSLQVGKIMVHNFFLAGNIAHILSA